MVVLTLADRADLSSARGYLLHSGTPFEGAGSSSAWQSTTFGTWGPEVQVLSPRPNMPRRKTDDDTPPETLEERWLLEAQTARNLEAFAAEREGRLEDAIALYERNVAEGFPGDLPYGRLVLIYERQHDLAAAERVLLRAIKVLEASRRRTPQDRRATVRVFQRRLKELGRRKRPEPGS